MRQVVELLKGVTTEDDGSAVTRQRPSSSSSSSSSSSGSSAKSGSSSSSNPYAIPLTAKRGLAIAYLEALTEEGFATGESQDELGRLLVDGTVEESGKLFEEEEEDEDEGNDEGGGSDEVEAGSPKSLGKRFRAKLRSFLASSKHYDAEKMLALLDEVGGTLDSRKRGGGGSASGGTQHEKALVLSRLGQHDRVLSIYVHQVGVLLVVCLFVCLFVFC